METTTLQSPKTGKSRFSKALPAPPSFLKAMNLNLKGLPSSPQPSKSHLPPARKPLPTVSGGPPAPPSKEAGYPISGRPITPSNTAGKPLDSPLPPMPPQTAKPSAPLPMIPRRPVAVGSTDLPSPDDDSSALSSLLSAYTDSNRSSDSTHISSVDGTNSASSAQDSYQVSPKHDASPFAAAAATATTSRPQLDELFFKPLSIQTGENNVYQNQERRGETQPTVQSITQQFPVPPSKDSNLATHSRSITELSKDSPSAGSTQLTPHAAPEATLPQSPQSQPQIWRRRSLKADKTLAVTELRLASSNGSSASSSLPPPAPPPKEPSNSTLLQPQVSTPSSGFAAPTRSPLPLTPNVTLPGRNIRPAASRQNLTEEGPDNMGQEVSRVKNTLKKANRGESADVARKESLPAPPRRASPPNGDKQHAKNASVSSPVRLPTPEYDTGDFKSPMVETVVSPVSPASSPELPVEPPRQQQATQETRHVHPAQSISSLSAGPNASRPEGSSNLAPKLSLQELGVRSPIGLPSSPAASRNPAPQPHNQFPARTTSKPEVEAKPPTVSTPRQEARTISEVGSEVGSVETIKPRRQEQPFPAPEIQRARENAREEDTTSNPGAQRFPRGWKAELPKDTVFRPVPISERHHRCITRHYTMHQVRNTYYPLACQGCGLKDSSWRFTCSSCNLRICKSCRTKLRKVNGDLRALKEHNDTVLVEQSTELEYDHEEAAIQNGKANAILAAQNRGPSQTPLARQR